MTISERDIRAAREIASKIRLSCYSGDKDNVADEIAKAIASERARCAKIAETYSPSDDHFVGDKIAKAIRKGD